jgi:hypothetical protein
VSERLSIVKAREHSHAHLWSSECTLSGDSQLAISEHRLWRALCEQRFHAQNDERPVSASDLTENLRRKLFSTSTLTIDAGQFKDWITCLVPLTNSPAKPFITAVEAASYLACRAFLTCDDWDAILEAQVEIAGPVKLAGARSNLLWEEVERKLFGAHVKNALTLLGRKAPHYAADPTGDLAPIPREYFASRVMLSLNNNIHHRDDASRPMYCEIAVSTAEFGDTFLAPTKPISTTGKTTKRTTRAPTKRDELRFRAWVLDFHSSRGFVPSIEDAEEFAEQNGLSREWVREQRRGLPDELRRPTGAKGSIKSLTKPRSRSSRD